MTTRRPISSVPTAAGGETVALHQALVDRLKQAGCIRNSHIEAAFRAVPRHLFLPGVPLDLVYRDEAIPTKELDGATVSSSSQPAIMAVMLEQLEIHPGHHVLEIGAGTGYNAALMAHIVGETGQVVTVDLDDDLVVSAREHLAAAGFNHVQVVCGEGGLGWPDSAPYDRILLTVGAPDILPAWREQLKPEGRLVLPLSIRGPQVSVAFEPAVDHLASVSVADCGFMRLRGAFAAPETTVPLGAQPGLRLFADDPSLLDAEAAYRWLCGPSRDWPTKVHVSPGEAFGYLRLWLALHEAGYCDLTAQGEWVDRGTVPHLFGWTAGGWKQCCTSGLLGESGLCVLMRPPDQALSPEQSRDSLSFELFVRSFGPDETLAHRLIEQVISWDTAGRPSTDTLRIRAYAPDARATPSARELVVQKRWTRLVLDWRPASGIGPRFTGRARNVIFFAQEEAAALGENFVGSEHLLLGLTRVPDSVGAQILTRLGIPLESIRDTIMQQVTRGQGNLGQDIQLTARARKIIDLAYDEARLLNNNYLGVEHLLLGMLSEGEGLAAQVLVKLGVSLERVRGEVRAMQAA